MKHLIWLSVLFIPPIFTLVQGQPTNTQPPHLTRHVILISIDGLHPDMYLDPSWPTPNLRQLMKQGVYAGHLKSVFPSYTYPSHTAMITGALPARSGVNFNQPIGSHGDWFWYLKAIKVPTLWQVCKQAGLSTASIEWPPSVMAHPGDISWNIPEIWDPKTPDDRIGEARKWATPGLVEEIEKCATGILDSNSMNGERLCLDENAARAAAYIFKTYRPAFLALHIAAVDDNEHEFGRDADSVRLAVEADDRAIGNLLETIRASGMQDSTTVIIVGDHGFCTINQVFRPNILIKDISSARFIAAGGSAFLYDHSDHPSEENTRQIIREVTKKLDSLPAEKRKLFRIIDRKELDRMGADSNAILALAATPGLVFSGSLTPGKTTNYGPGTLIQQTPLDGIFFPTHGGHHGYDPDIPDMWTGFIAAGAGIKKGGMIPQLGEQDIAPLIAQLLGITFKTPDGKLIPGILLDSNNIPGSAIRAASN
jgi:predicted AlkP superfamily pyrophosphatase or phosphodiesterase